MQLSRPKKIAALVFTVGLVFTSTSVSAQAVAQAPAVQKDIQPFATFALGPAPLQSKRFVNGGDHAAIEGSLGARKRISDLFGVVLSANYGKMLDGELGGSDALCRIPHSGQGACLPLSPVLNWFGASVGGEAYLGRAILGLQFGPTSVGVPAYEREFVAGSPSRSWGVRSQFEANFPVYRQLGISLAAADRYVPKVLNDKWHISTFSFGVTLREFHKGR